MKKERPLSIIPYYGGKAKMSSFIAERLDYTVSTFVTIFGGGCRELLNLKEHTYSLRFYNEYDRGLCALMETLANPETADILIDRLYYETEPTEAEFIKQQEIYNKCKYDLEEQSKKTLEQFLIKQGIIGVEERGEWIETAFCLAKANKMPEEVLKELFKNKKNISKRVYADFESVFAPWVINKYAKDEGMLPSSREIYAEKISNIDLAVATYITYTLSFSAMGRHFGKGKFKTDEQYRNHVLKLRDCTDVMKGVEVLNLDAMSFFRQMHYENWIKEAESEQDIKIAEKMAENNILYRWLLDPDVMIVADPSYISPNDEEKILHNEDEGIEIDVDTIDIEDGTTICEEITRRWKDTTMPKNLGSVYNRSFGYEEQEAFVRSIQNAKCKMLVCNYDLELYNRYLTPEKGWYKEIYPTKTSVFNNSNTTKSNERLEVIWRNY